MTNRADVAVPNQAFLDALDELLADAPGPRTGAGIAHAAGHIARHADAAWTAAFGAGAAWAGRRGNVPAALLALAAERILDHLCSGPDCHVCTQLCALPAVVAEQLLRHVNPGERPFVVEVTYRFRAITPDGHVWAEYDDPVELVRRCVGKDVVYEQLIGRRTASVWQSWEPDPELLADNRRAAAAGELPVTPSAMRAVLQLADRGELGDAMASPFHLSLYHAAAIQRAQHEGALVDGCVLTDFGRRLFTILGGTPRPPRADPDGP